MFIALFEGFGLLGVPGVEQDVVNCQTAPDAFSSHPFAVFFAIIFQ